MAKKPVFIELVFNPDVVCERCGCDGSYKVVDEDLCMQCVFNEAFDVEDDKTKLN